MDRCPLLTPCRDVHTETLLMLKLPLRAHAKRAEQEIKVMQLLHLCRVPFVPPLSTIEYNGVRGILTPFYPAVKSKKILFRSCLPVATIRKVCLQLFTVCTPHSLYLNEYSSCRNEFTDFVCSLIVVLERNARI